MRLLVGSLWVIGNLTALSSKTAMSGCY